jgi:cell division protein FtsB
MERLQTELFPIDHYGRYPVITLPNGWEVTNQSTKTKRKTIAPAKENDRLSTAKIRLKRGLHLLWRCKIHPLNKLGAS